MRRCIALLLTAAMLLSLGVSAFADTLTLPASIKTVEDEAFFGDTSLDEVVLPDGVETLGKNAFAESSVKKINLPDSLTSIGDNALPAPGTVKVTAKADTYAYSWAEERGYFAPAVIDYDMGGTTGTVSPDPTEFFYMTPDWTPGWPEVMETAAEITEWTSSDEEIAVCLGLGVNQWDNEGLRICVMEKSGSVTFSGYDALGRLRVRLSLVNTEPVASADGVLYRDFETLAGQQQQAGVGPATLLRDAETTFFPGFELRILDFGGHTLTVLPWDEDSEVQTRQEGDVTVYVIRRIPGDAAVLLRDGVEIARSNFISDLRPIHGDTIRLDKDAKIAPNLQIPAFSTITLITNGHGVDNGSMLIFVNLCATLLTDLAPEDATIIPGDSDPNNAADLSAERVGELYRYRNADDPSFTEYERTLYVNQTDSFDDAPELGAVVAGGVNWYTSLQSSDEPVLDLGTFGSIKAGSVPGRVTLSNYDPYSGNEPPENIIIIHYTVTEPAGVPIDETNFPDEVFRDWVAENCDDGDGRLSEEEIATVTEIDCSGHGIEDLTGIGIFTSLEKLTCSGYYVEVDEENDAVIGNDLKLLDVSGNPALQTLNCSTNQLTALNLSGCAALQTLNCYDNQLTSLDVSGCSALTELSCRYNQLTSLDVSGCSALQTLDCYSNQLTSLDVTACPLLAYLVCHHNQLTTLDISCCELLVAAYRSGIWYAVVPGDAQVMFYYENGQPVSTLLTDISISIIDTPSSIT